MKEFRIFFLLFIVISCSNWAHAQRVTGKVVYDFSLKLDGVAIPREATLLFTDTTSLFYHSRGSGMVMVDRDGRIGGPDMTYTTYGDHDGSLTMAFYVKDENGHTFYTNLIENKMLAREIVWMRPFLYKEPGLPDLVWEMADSSKMVGERICLMASAHFRGRDYTAWYTPEIPVPFGPWKLQGLPGLILEAHDAERHIVFAAKSFSSPLPQEQASEILPPQDGKEITFEEFKEIYWMEQLRINKKMKSTEHRDAKETGLMRMHTMEVFVEKEKR